MRVHLIINIVIIFGSNGLPDLLSKKKKKICFKVNIPNEISIYEMALVHSASCGHLFFLLSEKNTDMLLRLLIFSVFSSALLFFTYYSAHFYISPSWYFSLSSFYLFFFFLR